MKHGLAILAPPPCIEFELAKWSIALCRYKKLLTMLKNAGCSFKGNGVRPSPSDTNLCLSILDLRFPAPLPSRTVQLNSMYFS